jgi:hypothetical protein
MKCERCDKPAMRVGTKHRGYCFAHDAEAFEQMKKDAKRKDIQNVHRGEELRMEAHRMLLMVGS